MKVLNCANFRKNRITFILYKTKSLYDQLDPKNPFLQNPPKSVKYTPTFYDPLSFISNNVRIFFIYLNKSSIVKIH